LGRKIWLFSGAYSYAQVPSCLHYQDRSLLNGQIITSTQRAEILNHVVNVAQILKTTPSIEEPKLKPVPNNIEQEVSDYRQELEAEQRT
jgi:hypothetical protein